MSRASTGTLTALASSVAVHAGVLLWVAGPALQPPAPPPPPLEVRVELPPPAPVAPPQGATVADTSPVPALKPPPLVEPASLAAPPAPTAEEWKLASTYTLKNGKRYRHAWGRQVRSMMGTAVEGPDQGLVRFRITIHPDGRVAQVEELWSTSAKASQLALQAIRNLPPLPPTPTGKPLVFEQTISFVPFETGWPPSYKLDCLPDPPTFRNPFVWDGRTPPPIQPSGPEGVGPPADTVAQVECDTSGTGSSIEEEERELARQMDQNRWGR